MRNLIFKFYGQPDHMPSIRVDKKDKIHIVPFADRYTDRVAVFIEVEEGEVKE